MKELNEFTYVLTEDVDVQILFNINKWLENNGYRCTNPYTNDCKWLGIYPSVKQYRYDKVGYKSNYKLYTPQEFIKEYIEYVQPENAKEAIINKEFVVIIKTLIIIGDTNIVHKKAKSFPADTKISEIYKWIDTIPNAFGNVELLKLE